jgi:two-component system, OmpR family, KDP operon response regulator KdpE
VTRVLVVDDEPQIRRALSLSLLANGYEVEAVETGEQAVTQAGSNNPDLILLDLGLPGMDGLAVVYAIRGWSDVPIIILSVREDERGKVEALDAGADDYITKPFGVNELLARMRAALRRRQTAGEQALESPIITTPHFVLDLSNRKASNHASGETRLTPIEWELVDVLVRNPGRLVTQKMLLTKVWGPQWESETAYLRVHMAHIRRKLEPVPSIPRYFVTEPGLGLRFLPVGQE